MYVLQMFCKLGITSETYKIIIIILLMQTVLSAFTLEKNKHFAHLSMHHDVQSHTVDFEERSVALTSIIFIITNMPVEQKAAYQMSNKKA